MRHKIIDADAPNVLEIIVDGKLYKEIAGYRNYFIASDGSVYNLKYRRPLEHFTLKTGHHLVRINGDNGGKRKNLYIHRIVAETWLENPDNLPIIHHINRDITDNRAENLKWVSVEEHRERMSEVSFGGRKRGGQAIYQGVVYDSIADLAEQQQIHLRTAYAWRDQGLVTILQPEPAEERQP